MAGIRVRLLFPDDEKYWLLVDNQKCKIIQNVMDTISEMFSVNCDKLTMEDAQLHPKETVGILQDKDLIR